MRLLYIPNKYSQQRQKQKPANIYPVLMAMEATHMRNLGHDISWNNANGIYDEIITKPQGIDFLSLPIPDRCWTNAFDKRYQLYGNYKYHPATHMQVADGCSHGACVFCVENNKKYKIRNINDVKKEIEICSKLGFKEIFDDSGTFPTGNWLKEFCDFASYQDIIFGCNMRIGVDVDFKMMKKAGFRMVLFGIESANQETLNKINKKINVNQIEETLIKASEVGLEPHGAFMFGYPWEVDYEENKTIELCHKLLRKGYLKTAQASLYTVNGNKFRDSDKVNKIYNVAIYPEFWINKIKDIKNFNDFKYFIKCIKKGIIRD